MPLEQANFDIENDVIVYCDEAGNTGPNYVDPDQPFYVLAAWSVPYNRIPDAAAAVELVRKKYTSQAPELSSSYLLRKNDGAMGAIVLIENLAQLGCVPFFVLAEKRYCIAGKIIETFLDPPTNPRVNNHFTTDTTTKQEIANTLYDHLSDDELNTFACAYRKPELAAFGKAFEIVTSAIRARINPELAELFEGARPNLEEITSLEAGNLFGSFFDTLNHPILASMFTMVERAARAGLIRPRKFVHDKSHAYEEGFKKLFGLMRNAGDGIFKYPNGAVALFPLRSVPEFEMVCSKENVLVQAADVLAGSIRECAMVARDGKPASEVLNQLTNLTLPLMFIDKLTVAWPVASDRWYVAMGRMLFGSSASKEPQKPSSSNAKLPASSPAPLFPIVGSPSALDDETRRFSIPFPVYGLLGMDSGCLHCVGDVEFLADRGGSTVVLFPKREDAERWLRIKEPGTPAEPFEIRQFDVPQLQEFLRCLRMARSITSTVSFYDGGEVTACIDLAEFINGTERSLDRAKRAVFSGAARQIYQLHVVGGIQVQSMLASEGTYVAMKSPSGPSFRAPTRQLAIDEVVAHEKAVHSLPSMPDEESR